MRLLCLYLAGLAAAIVLFGGFAGLAIFGVSEGQVDSAPPPIIEIAPQDATTIIIPTSTAIPTLAAPDTSRATPNSAQYTATAFLANATATAAARD